MSELCWSGCREVGRLFLPSVLGRASLYCWAPEERLLVVPFALELLSIIAEVSLLTILIWGAAMLNLSESLKSSLLFK